jgi:Mg/Co/Ni transporter MgtE
MKEGFKLVHVYSISCSLSLFILLFIVIRCLAVGTLRPDNVKPFLGREMVMGICLTLILGIAGFLRVYVFDTPLPQAFATTASLLVITMSSIVIGATLPLLMNLCRIDPAHASTTIQVLMDILGVTCTVYVSGAILTSEDDAVGEGY